MREVAAAVAVAVAVAVACFDSACMAVRQAQHTMAVKSQLSIPTHLPAGAVVQAGLSTLSGLPTNTQHLTITTANFFQ